MEELQRCGCWQESSRKEHFAHLHGAVTTASTHRFSTVHPGGAHQAGLAQPYKQPAVRKPHPSTGQPSDLAAVSGSAVSTELEAVTPSPRGPHSSVFAEAEEEWTERALPWQQAVTVSLGADGEVVLRHALATTFGFCKV